MLHQREKADLRANYPSLAGKRVIVTGGGSGIGAGLVAAFAAQGAKVAFVDVADEDSTALAERLAETSPFPPIFTHLDLRDLDALARTFAEMEAQLGGVDILVNNAAVFTPHPIDTTSYQDWRSNWRETFEANLFAAADITWHVTRHLLERAEGPAGARVLMVGSRGAFRGEPVSPAYGASKAALHALAQSLAVSLAPHGIAVTAVAPGFTHTEMAADLLSGEQGPVIRAQSPFNRVAEPREIAAAVVWLTSAEAEWASGAVLDLNGASYLR
jgi:3-oxoacyl-[acyl-carrier protein] reductase